MRLENLLTRISHKVDADLESDECYSWPTPVKRKPVMAICRDANGRPERRRTFIKQYPTISHNGKARSVHKFLYEHFFGATSERLVRTCATMDCVNPKHWVPRTKNLPEYESPDDLWTIDEAEELLEIYLETNSRVDPNHPLLVDIPEDLLEQTLEHMNKGHLLCR